MDMQVIKGLAQPSDKKIVMLVMDGLGGLPIAKGGPTELEAAKTPNLDSLAKDSELGLHIPVARGITPGSGPAHLGLFGYDPLKHEIGRGVLEAVGIDFNIKDTDVAARGNFATVDEQGIITDRRAGRISTEKATELAKLLNTIKMPSGQVFVQAVKEHRFMVVFRDEGLSDALTDSDPGRVGEKPLQVQATKPEAKRTAEMVNYFISEADKILTKHHPANAGLLRGFATHPKLPSMEEIYGLKTASVAIYPMYRGLAKLVGMEALPTGSSFKDQIATVAKHYKDYDYFFIHFKKTDSSGEDGAFDRKVQAIEEVDAELPALLNLSPDVLIITGDHSTPAALSGHSWHPVPLLLNSPYVRPSATATFGERACASGALGIFPATDIMPMALAHALRLAKYGA